MQRQKMEEQRHARGSSRRRARRLLARQAQVSRGTRIIGGVLFVIVCALGYYAHACRHHEQRVRRQRVKSLVRVVPGTVNHIDISFESDTGAATVSNFVVTYETEPGVQTTRTFDYATEVTSDTPLPRVGDTVYVSIRADDPEQAFVVPSSGGGGGDHS